jgi:hypothetical protein
MRLTIVRLGQVFVKPREWTLPKKGVGPLKGLKIGLANVVMMVGIAVVIYWFGIPSPDIRHDLRCLLISDFQRYSESKRKINYLESFDERRVRAFQFEDGRMKKRAVYGPHNEDMFRVQDYLKKT